MPAGFWNLEFLNHNSQRKYPLADDASARDTSDSFEIPDDFIVELDLPIHAGMDVDPARFFIRQIAAYATGYGIVVGYQPTVGDAVDVATALISRIGHTRNRSYALGGVDTFDDTLGKVVIGRLDAIDEQPPGTWEFELEATRLDPDAVRPMIRGVSSIVVVNGTQRSAPIRGVIELVAGTNMQIVPIVISGQDPIIRFNAVSGEGLKEECICEGEAAPADPVRTIMGIAPTASGEFTIVGSECVGVETIANGVRIIDKCSKPCCGCPELETITRDLESSFSQQKAVQDFVDRLGVSVTTMDMIVLGSRLGDRSCVDCDG